MTVLADSVRAKIWSDFMSDGAEAIAMNKTELRNGINALDDYVETTLDGAIAALDGTPAASLSLAQKFDLYNLIVKARTS